MERQKLTESEYFKHAMNATNKYIKNTYGIDPDTVKDQTKARWTVSEGSAVCYIEFYFNEAGDLLFGVTAPIVYIPERNKEECFRDLLEANAAKFVVSSFEIKDDIIYLRHTRHVKEIDESEIFFAIEELSRHADSYDNLLEAKYGCKICGKEPEEQLI